MINYLSLGEDKLSENQYQENIEDKLAILSMSSVTDPMQATKRDQNAFGVLDFLDVIENLKTTKRTGWLDNHVKEAESIADHMHRMGIMSLLINDYNVQSTDEEPKLSTSRMVLISICHDIGESIVGDITPFGGVSNEDKFQLENRALDKLKETIGDSRGDLIKELWLEYEKGETPESKIVKELDKFEMLVQAFEYERREKKRLDSFFLTTNKNGIYFKSHRVRSWYDELNKRREEFFKSL